MKMARFLKMFKILGLVIIIASCKVSLPSQSNTIQSDQAFIENDQIISFKVDKLNNIYTIDKRSELTKYGPGGEKLFSYTDRTLGSIDYLDVSNPLKILAFYRDYQSIVFMDNTLSVTSRFNLADSGFQDATAIGLSNDNNLWIYDMLDSRLKKITDDGKVLIESDLLTTYLKDFNPDFIRETNNYLLVNDPTIGFHLFDNFAKYINTAKVGSLKEFQFKDNKVLFVKDDIIQGWDVNNYQRDSFDLTGDPLNMVEHFYLLSDGVMVLTQGKILKLGRK